jgi:hypothetical protein
MKDCTFKPKTQFASEPRSLEEFLYGMEKAAKNKAEFLQ